MSRVSNNDALWNEAENIGINIASSNSNIINPTINDNNPTFFERNVERYEYNIVASYKEDDEDVDFLERYEQLMRFLNP